jgi:hypothetical protein
MRVLIYGAGVIGQVRYWQTALRGPVGTLSIAPHVRATRTTEFAALAADVRGLTHGQAPRLENLLAAAVACRRRDLAGS